jgi:hypothetical protein
LQNIWLIGLAVITALALVGLNVVRSHKGVLFHDTLLDVKGTVDNAAYSGEAHGEAVSIVVSRHSETGISTVLDFAFGPPMESRGDSMLFLYGVLMAVMAAVQVAFPNALFQWNNRWYVKDPEPTEFYFGMMRLSSGILTTVMLILYIMALRTIP